MSTETIALPSHPSTPTPPPSAALHRGLWVAQVVVAIAMLGAGATKATAPLDQLAASMPWIPSFPELAVRAIGVAEVLGALGLVLPAALRVLPFLTPLAALGLGALMAGAVHTELGARGAGGAIAPAFLGGLSLFIAWGRARAAKIAAR